jgi:uncharacterized protein with FMN-binding domain
MKRTLALVGLLFLGMLLLFNPDTGLVSGVTNDVALAQTAPATQTTTTGAPPRTTTPATVAPSTSVTVTEPANYSVLGASIPTEFGPLQVELVIEDGKMTDIVTVAEPTDRKSARINGYAIPLYEEAAISSQSADIDAISGATVTWRAYTASIQSAMDQAGL